MPFGEVKLVPGVNVERTPTLLEAGYTSSQLIRFKDGLAQKYGGWSAYYPLVLSGTPRDLHAWNDLNSNSYLAIGTTTSLSIITGGDLSEITPQTLVSDFAPDFDTTMGSTEVTVTDPNIMNLTVYDTVLFNTPVSVDGIILSGLYPILRIAGATSYVIDAATAGVSGVTAGGAVPEFTTTANSNIVNVMLEDHATVVGDTVVFPVPTTQDGVTIEGSYLVLEVIDADNFTISAATQATAGATFDMNGGNVEVVYYIALGPPAAGTGYGLGDYGAGGYGTGVIPSEQVGTAITATDWSTDNWGQILIACPENGGIYYWDPTGGFYTASLVSSGPIFNRGAFVSTSQQLMVAYGSTVDYAGAGQGIGLQQDPMLVAWSDVGNFLEWRPLTTTQAGNFRIPIGSELMGGIAAQNQNLIWSDLDLWAMNYIGYPNVFGFNRIGVGAGLVSSHAAQALRGGLYWMGPSNFYSYGGSGAQVIPCPVWDAVFQNLNTDYQRNIRAMPNTPFNEAGWLYPSAASVNGECDSYVKVNITEPGAPWDIGQLPRSAWIDQNVIGSPIAATPTGIVYTQESGNDAAGQPMGWSFQTGYFYLTEGEEFVFIDMVIPDFKFGTYGGAQTAQVQLTFYVQNYPGQAPEAYGPYTVTQATEYISVRFRARQVSLKVSGADLGSFVRLGKVRFRYGASGRR